MCSIRIWQPYVAQEVACDIRYVHKEQRTHFKSLRIQISTNNRHVQEIVYKSQNSLWIFSILISSPTDKLLTLKATMVLQVLMGISLITLFNLCCTQQAGPVPSPISPLTVTNTSSISSPEYAFPKYKHSSFDVESNWAFCNLTEKQILPNDTISDYAPYINEALQSLKNTGGAVRLMDGSYPISSQINMVSNSCIVGAGMHRTIIVVKDASVFDQAGGVVMGAGGERISLIGFVSFYFHFLFVLTLTFFRFIQLPALVDHRRKFSAPVQRWRPASSRRLLPARELRMDEKHTLHAEHPSRFRRDRYRRAQSGTRLL